MPDGSREFLAAAAGVKTGMEYEDVLMRNQKLAAENARLREELQRYKDYEDMKQRWAEEALRESSTRSTPRPPIGNPPHGE